MDETHDETPSADLVSNPSPVESRTAHHLNPGGPPRPLSYWLRKFFACNPFYLVSAGLLLYGVYLVSADDGLLRREIFQLTFNFSSLQLYEGLLVVTAIVLARRRIWYDSLLLVGLENLLVLVPFILISQAALLNPRFVWVICAVGGLAAVGRFWGLKRFLRELNLPRRALVFGLVLLVINVALPLIFRHLHESKVGTKPTDGAAYEMNRYCWRIGAAAGHVRARQPAAAPGCVSGATPAATTLVADGIVQSVARGERGASLFAELRLQF